MAAELNWKEDKRLDLLEFVSLEKNAVLSYQNHEKIGDIFSYNVFLSIKWKTVKEEAKMIDSPSNLKESDETPETPKNQNQNSDQIIKNIVQTVWQHVNQFEESERNKHQPLIDQINEILIQHGMKNLTRIEAQKTTNESDQQPKTSKREDQKHEDQNLDKKKKELSKSEEVSNILPLVIQPCEPYVVEQEKSYLKAMQKDYQLEEANLNTAYYSEIFCQFGNFFLVICVF